MKHASTMALAVFVALGSATPATAAPNPCNLVSKAEAARALGVPVLPASPSPGDENTECRYYNAQKDQNVLVEVHHSVSTYPDGMIGMPGITALPQIGPKAWEGSGTVYMVKHGTYVTIGIYKGANIKSDAAAIKLAKIAASRM